MLKSYNPNKSLFSGSVVGLTGNTGQSVYSASKAGLVGFTKSLAKELAPKGITVNLVVPGMFLKKHFFNLIFIVVLILGFVRTDMTSNFSESEYTSFIPLQRFGNPEEVANATFFLSNATFVTGEMLIVDGGLHLTN